MAQGFFLWLSSYTSLTQNPKSKKYRKAWLRAWNHSGATAPKSSKHIAVFMSPSGLSVVLIDVFGAQDFPVYNITY